MAAMLAFWPHGAERPNGDRGQRVPARVERACFRPQHCPPTCIELRDYPPAPPGGAAEAVIGWIGTRVNLMYLDTIRAALGRVGQGINRPRLKVVCDAFPDMSGIEVEKKIWALKDEPGDARSFQIGIMPLPDDVWTRGKCGLKLLQYMAASVPVVCSPVGANCAIVENGVNGFHAVAESEWVDRLERLLANTELRARLGKAGRERLNRATPFRQMPPVHPDPVTGFDM